jgi:hypothetical protein
MDGRRTWSPEKGSVVSEEEGEKGEVEDEGEGGPFTRCLGGLRMTISPS